MYKRNAKRHNRPVEIARHRSIWFCIPFDPNYYHSHAVKYLLLFFCLLHQFEFINSANIFLLPAKLNIQTKNCSTPNTSIFVACYKTIDLFILHLRNWANAKHHRSTLGFFFFCSIRCRVRLFLFHSFTWDYYFFFSLTSCSPLFRRIDEKNYEQLLGLMQNV